LAWVLRAAFSHTALETPPEDAAPLVRLAETFELDRRILVRHGEELVASVLGREVAARWRGRRRDGVARVLLVEQLVERLASAARSSGAPAVLLKGAALLAGGHGAPGVRRLADVDLLLAVADESRLRAELLRRGFTPDGLAEPHHSPPLVDRALGIVELHTRLPGLSLKGGAPLDVESLRVAGLVRPAAGAHRALDGLLVPVPSFLAAHVATHALYQHGSSPAGYPGLRWVGDLLDLAQDAAELLPGASSAAEELLREAQRTCELELSARELAAASGVCTALGRGTLPPAESDAARLLLHSLALALDEQYRGALRVRHLARSLLLDRSHLRRRIRQRATVAARDDRRSRLPVVGLAGRLARDLGSWTRVHLRRRARLLS
jgi:hypothetical protein